MGARKRSDGGKEEVEAGCISGIVWGEAQGQSSQVQNV